MNKLYLLISLYLGLSASLFGHGGETFRYRVVLKDKGTPHYTLDNPQEYLSQKSIDRRTRQYLAVDSTDLPIDTTYIRTVEATGVNLQLASKWTNTLVVYTQDESLLQAVKDLPFVEDAYPVWKDKNAFRSSGKEEKEENENKERNEGNEGNENNDINSYSSAYNQISLHKGQQLHDAGYRGEGMWIAVIDGGFTNVDKIVYFDPARIREAKDFSHKREDPYRVSTEHGTQVLSCMLSNIPGQMIGTAPEADYSLYRTELDGEEYPIEEDYWIAALEYADSTGVDVVTSSLGYTTFDDSSLNHTHEQLDGKTVFASRAASMAASKGMLLFVSAGNEGNKSWKKIGVPADASQVLTVGAVTGDKVRSTFSSLGMSADGRVKPDIMAKGTSASVINSRGVVSYSNGTSFATPIIAGLGACLWQSLPNLTAKEMVALMQTCSDRYTRPDSMYGYGIPDVFAAYSDYTSVPKVDDEQRYLYIDQPSGRLYVNLPPDEKQVNYLTIYTGMGVRVLERKYLSESIDIQSLPKGVYIACLQVRENRYVRKFVKF